MRRAAFVILLCACGPLNPPTTDAGSGGGGATGGGQSTGGGGGTITGGGGGGVTGGGGGGGGATTGGGTGGGGDGIWDFGAASLSPAPGTSADILGFTQTDAGVLAVSSAGRVYVSTGGAFTELVNLGGYYVDFEALPNGHLFLLSPLRFKHCLSNCADAGSWTEVSVGGSGDSLSTLCAVDETNVLAIGTRSSSTGIVFKWNGTAFEPSASVGADNPRDCFRAASGDYYLASDDGAARYSPSMARFYFEPITTNTAFVGGGDSPSGEWITARGPIFARRDGGTWTPTALGTGVDVVRAIVGVSPTLAFGFGGGGTGDGQCGYVFNGTTWSKMPTDIPAMNQARAVFRATDGTIYVGGNDVDSKPCIVVGTRR